MYTKEEAKKHIAELAENFGSKLDFIKTSGQYKEAQIEDEFIKPLFKYLNWNISNVNIESSKLTVSQRIDLIDKQIDGLVYGLYELTPEEIKILEETDV